MLLLLFVYELDYEDHQDSYLEEGQVELDGLDWDSASVVCVSPP